MMKLGREIFHGLILCNMISKIAVAIEQATHRRRHYTTIIPLYVSTTKNKITVYTTIVKTYNH